MKKNTFMRVASALLVAVLLTTCAIAGTFAKYTTSKESTDTARVAKWGVVINVEVDGAFATEYEADATDYTASANTVVSSGTDNLLAPGTSGDLLADATISGTPEVAVRITKEATLELTGWVANGDYYCPLVITVDGTNVVKGTDYASAAEFIAAVEALLDDVSDYAPNTDLAESHSVTWEWAFEGDNVKDTALGNAAVAGDITIAFTLSITVEQID